MAKLNKPVWFKRLVTLCLILILVSLVGHFMADTLGFSVDSLLTVDLHGSVALNLLAAFVTTLVATIVVLLIQPNPLYWHPSPTSPPPILAL